jgi:methylated-DNA-[protein]-cysteine S-methyltransferase
MNMSSATAHPTIADQHFHTDMQSPVGALRLIATDTGLRAVLWPNDAPGRISLPASERHDGHPVLAKTVAQLGEYFGGQRQDFDIPLDLRGTEFQCEAWTALADIPFGTTTTYAEQAGRLGRPSAVRAVGAANGRNPLSIVLPCHRVIGADGSLTGFAGGLDTKRRLLELEGGLSTPTLPFI